MKDAIDNYYDGDDKILLGCMLWVGVVMGIAFWGGVFLGVRWLLS